jgi:hypothetical protein
VSCDPTRSGGPGSVAAVHASRVRRRPADQIGTSVADSRSCARDRGGPACGPGRPSAWQAAFLGAGPHDQSDRPGSPGVGDILDISESDFVADALGLAVWHDLPVVDPAPGDGSTSPTRPGFAQLRLGVRRASPKVWMPRCSKCEGGAHAHGGWAADQAS